MVTVILSRHLRYAQATPVGLWPKSASGFSVLVCSSSNVLFASSSWAHARRLHSPATIASAVVEVRAFPRLSLILLIFGRRACLLPNCDASRWTTGLDVYARVFERERIDGLMISALSPRMCKLLGASKCPYCVSRAEESRRL